MRQRRLKNLDEKLEEYGQYRLTDAHERRGAWHGYFGREGDMFLEIGSGKGKFLMSLAEAFPENDYIGFECQQSVLVRALEKACAAGMPNIVFADNKVYDIRSYFADDELAGIYLNFSDPWPKARHAKRRLTHRDFLRAYRDVVRSGGFIEFNTDNDDLIEFTIDDAGAAGFETAGLTRDLHSSGHVSASFTTEYEEKFMAQGKNINYVKICIDKG
ncbi:MAG: tRNA (guanosine(46)-N7)-methyltransferase TrmB [Anaerovoracaceae bacterium]|nr:tRNA (guanosine(46)-N7)-methyltransferase TrmB [Anaerovoracaceae bacterium]